MTYEHEIETRERLARLWSEVEGNVQAYVGAAIRGFQDAEDVTQQVALTVARRFDEYDASRPFIAWALWLAKSRIIDFYRKRDREKVIFDDEVLDKLAAALVERQPERSARQVALETCLEKLPEKSRTMLNLRYMEEQPIEAVAQAIRSTPGSVRVMLFRVREVLAECIQQQIAQEARA